MESKVENYRENAWVTHMELIRGLSLIVVMVLTILSSPQLSSSIPFTKSLVIVISSLVYYTLAFLFADRIILRRKVFLRLFKHFQSVLNLLLITTMVHFTGGINSYYIFFYVLEILISNFLMSQEDCYLESSLAWMAYCLLLLCESYGFLPHFSEPVRVFDYWDMEAILKSVFQLLIVLYGITWLGGYLHIFLKFRSKELEKVVERLEDQNLALTEMSMTDSLTGLYNRRYFFQRLLEEVKRSERYSHSVSLIMTDLDHFKKVNDSYGHPCGDNVLRDFSEILKTSGRAMDVAVRYGGEEFALILPETKSEEARILAERLRLKTAEQMFSCPTGEKRLKITASFGLASFPGEAANLEDLIEKADKALYRAKRHGRNRVCLNGEKVHASK
jgi:diguanylate cyclase (GGDEF)-like protein